LTRLNELLASGTYHAFAWKAIHALTAFAVMLVVIGFARDSTEIKVTSLFALFSCGVAYITLYLNRTPADGLRNQRIVIPLFAVCVCVIILCVAILAHMNEFSLLFER
jgi:heme/copper-type cytochrome/quinol oxidase subunit 4